MSKKYVPHPNQHYYQVNPHSSGPNREYGGQAAPMPMFAPKQMAASATISSAFETATKSAAAADSCDHLDATCQPSQQQYYYVAAYGQSNPNDASQAVPQFYLYYPSTASGD